jgi:hypothetical protein
MPTYVERIQLNKDFSIMGLGLDIAEEFEVSALYENNILSIIKWTDNKKSAEETFSRIKTKLQELGYRS